MPAARRDHLGSQYGHEVLPRFEIVRRERPVAIVGDAVASAAYDVRAVPPSAAAATPYLAPYAAIEVGLRAGSGVTELSLHGPDGSTLSVVLEGRSTRLRVAVGDATTEHRSRRHGTCTSVPTRLGLALTGPHLSVLTLEGGVWVVRGRVGLDRLDHPGAGLDHPGAGLDHPGAGLDHPGGRLDIRDGRWLAGLTSSWASTASPGSDPLVTDWSAGTFGQLGLRDLRLVTEADGSPYRPHAGALLFTATSAGPGFFDTAHTSVWISEHGAELRHRADLFFERPDRPGAWGDHASHLVRLEDRWLVATSTWADFPADKKERRSARVGITLAESTADLTRGQHRLATRALDLPTEGPSVGMWDPHLVRTVTAQGSTEWLVGYVSARRFFDFHPVLASGPSLDRLTLRGAAPDRHATEGTTLARLDDEWRVLASDGRDSPRSIRRRYPVLDLDLREVGALDAPYPTNIPWPTVVPPAPDDPEGDWSLVTFNGTPYGGPLTGYGTHGDVVVMRAARGASSQSLEGS